MFMHISHLPQSKYLDSNKLAAIFSNTTNSYKFFWFGEIIKRAIQGVEVDSIRHIVEDMLISAYYMVNECKLKLGFNDKLEETVKYIYDKYRIQTNLFYKQLKIEFNNQSVYDDIIVAGSIDLLKNYVPFCLLSPFVGRTKIEKRFSRSNINLFNETYENQKKNDGITIPYRFGIISGIDTEIMLDNNFIDYVENNYGILNDFAKYNLVEYLQKKNPSVPGIINKLEPAVARDLKKVIDFYKDVVTYDNSKIYDIYTGKELKDIVKDKELSIDHFIPWSYVAHDEIWNLTPTIKSINSSKGNRLPNWNKYFGKLINQKIVLHKVIWQNENVHNSFNKIQDIYLNIDEIKNAYNNPNISMYEFKNCMYNYMKPIYEVAERSGFAAGWSV